MRASLTSPWPPPNADLETQLVTAVRDKAVDAFNSIMDMSA